jgi:hypothetical protein
MQQHFCDSDIWIGTKEFAQNAGNRISKVLDFKISLLVPYMFENLYLQN